MRLFVFNAFTVRFAMNGIDFHLMSRSWHHHFQPPRGRYALDWDAMRSFADAVAQAPARWICCARSSPRRREPSSPVVTESPGAVH